MYLSQYIFQQPTIYLRIRIKTKRYYACAYSILFWQYQSGVLTIQVPSTSETQKQYSKDLGTGMFLLVIQIFQRNVLRSGSVIYVAETRRKKALESGSMIHPLFVEINTQPTYSHTRRQEIEKQIVQLHVGYARIYICTTVLHTYVWPTQFIQQRRGKYGCQHSSFAPQQYQGSYTVFTTHQETVQGTYIEYYSQVHGLSNRKSSGLVTTVLVL